MFQATVACAAFEHLKTPQNRQVAPHSLLTASTFSVCLLLLSSAAFLWFTDSRKNCKCQVSTVSTLPKYFSLPVKTPDEALLWEWTLSANLRLLYSKGKTGNGSLKNMKCKMPKSESCSNQFHSVCRIVEQHLKNNFPALELGAAIWQQSDNRAHSDNHWARRWEK